jgi:hypothetical protein
MAKLRPHVRHVTTNSEWVFRRLAFSFEIATGFSLPAEKNGRWRRFPTHPGHEVTNLARPIPI